MRDCSYILPPMMEQMTVAGRCGALLTLFTPLYNHALRCGYFISFFYLLSLLNHSIMI